MNWLRIVKILVGLLIAAGIGWAVYYFFYQSPAGTAFISSIFPGAEQNQPAETQTQKLQALSETAIFDYWMNSATGDIFYMNESGQVLKISNSNEAMVNSQTVNKVNRVIPSFDGTYAVAEFNYPNLPLFSILNTVTGNWQLLPADTIAAGWSPNTPEIAYIDGRALKILNLVDGKTREIMKFSQKELNLSWPTTGKIILSSLPTSQLNTHIWTIDLQKKTLVSSVIEAGSSIHWSKDGALGIKISTVNNKSRINLIDPNGSSLSEFTFVTMPEKCGFGTDKIYCAIPKNIQERTVLPDDYYKKSVFFDDLIYLIDLSNGNFTEIPTGSAEPIDAEHLEISGGKLLFKNRLDDKLYSLTL